MKKIKELAWWFGWFKQRRPFLGAVFVASSFVLFVLSALLVRSALASEHLIWLVVSVCLVFIIVVLFSFFFWVGLSFKYIDDSRNWRLVVDKGWEFANKNHEALPEIEKLIEIVKVTEDPKELNEFMEKWKSPEEKKIELIKKLECRKEELQEKLKEIQDIMSGKKEQEIKKEIEKIKEELRKI